MLIPKLLVMMERHLPARFIAVTATLMFAGVALAQTAPVTGTWQMDAAKSHVADGRNVTLTVEMATTKVTVSSITQNKAGSELNVAFTCTVDGKECEFAEGSHKSKVSMWFLGDALNICKTGGPAGDVVNQWKLQPSADGTVLTLTVNHLEPTAADETLVFHKKGS